MRAVWGIREKRGGGEERQNVDKVEWEGGADHRPKEGPSFSCGLLPLPLPPPLESWNSSYSFELFLFDPKDQSVFLFLSRGWRWAKKDFQCT